MSTPITDVAEPYGHIVYLGETPDEFLAACEAALAASAEERAACHANAKGPGRHIMGRDGVAYGKAAGCGGPKVAPIRVPA